MMDKFRLKIVCGAAAAALLAGACLAGKEAVARVMGKNVAGDKKLCVMIDAGHGGDESRLKNDAGNRNH